MATPSWNVNGQYYETCSCDFVCPCLPGQMAVEPSKGSCTFAMAFQIERGRYGATALDGLGFIVLGFTPGAMGKGNWLVGLVDRRARERRPARRDHRDRERRRRGTDGGAHGPRRHLPRRGVGAHCLHSRWCELVGEGGGVRRHGGVGGDGDEPRRRAEPLQLDNTGHPAANRFTLARASKSHVNALGLKWDDLSGTNNGQYAPFSWQGA